MSYYVVQNLLKKVSKPSGCSTFSWDNIYNTHYLIKNLLNPNVKLKENHCACVVWMKWHDS